MAESPKVLWVFEEKRNLYPLEVQSHLGGGFKYLLCSPPT